MLFALKNNFHNSEATVRAEPGQELTVRQIRRAATALCGVAGCSCSGYLGTRGRQDVEIRQHYADNVFGITYSLAERERKGEHDV